MKITTVTDDLTGITGCGKWRMWSVTAIVRRSECCLRQ